MTNEDEGKEMIRLCVGLCQPPNNLEWAQLFVEGLICVERFINMFEICKNDNLVFTLLGTLKVVHDVQGACELDRTASYLSCCTYFLLS